MRTNVALEMRMGALWLAVCLLLLRASAGATDQGITGKKLLLKSTPKVVLLSKDPSISIAGADPVGGANSSISFDDGNGPVTFSLPASLWSTNGSGTLFKYKNTLAPGGPSAVKIVKVKAGLLKVVAKGLPFAVPNGPATINVVLRLDGATNSYCMSFTGTGDGSRLLVKDAAAGICSPSTGPACCEQASGCSGGTAELCTGFIIGTPVGNGAVCGQSGNCSTPGSATPGACCQVSFPPFCAVPTDASTCAGAGGSYHPSGICSPDGTCSGAGQLCGNNLRELSEECDGSDSSTCSGICQADCTCPSPVCGNGVLEAGEECDGLAISACGGRCQQDCTCCAMAGGYCWYKGLPGQSCDAACAASGLTCSSGTITYAGSAGTLANCAFVVAALGASSAPNDYGCDNGSGCWSNGGGFSGRCFLPATTCGAASITTVGRVCACE